MAIVKLTKDQIADIFKRVVGRNPTHNDYPAIVGLFNMDNMTVAKIEEFFAPLKSFVIPAPAPVVPVVKPAPVPAPVQVKPPVPAPVKVTPAPASVKLAPSVEPKPVVKPFVPVVTTPAPVPVKHVVTQPVKTAWDEDKTPVDMPAAKKEYVEPKHTEKHDDKSTHEKHVDKPMQSANIPGKKKGKK